MAVQGLVGIDSFTAAKEKHLREMQFMMASAIDQSANILFAEMKLLTSRIDHDLNDLRRMGHPYRKDDPPGIPHDDWIVHIQNGDLTGGMQRYPVAIMGRKIEAQIVSRAKHTWYLLLGTRKMRPRDFVSASMLIRQDEIERIITNAFLTALGAEAGRRYNLNWKLIAHDTYPAQLPGNF